MCGLIASALFKYSSALDFNRALDCSLMSAVNTKKVKTERNGQVISEVCESAIVKYPAERP